MKLTKENYTIAYGWIENQINKKALSDNGFSEIAYTNIEGISLWCNEYLTAIQTKRLNGNIRQTLSKRSTGSKQITLNSEAHIILKGMAKRQGVTLSELIIRELKHKWHSLPEETTKQTPIAPIAPVNKPKTDSKTITLPTCKAEYNKLVERLKLTDSWQKRNSQEQNLARIFKANGVSLPDNKMTKAGLTAYLKTLH